MPNDPSAARTGREFAARVADDSTMAAALRTEHDRAELIARTIAAAREVTAAALADWFSVGAADAAEMSAHLAALGFPRPDDIDGWLHIARVIERDPGPLTLGDIYAEAVAWADREKVRAKLRAEAIAAGQEGRVSPAIPADLAAALPRLPAKQRQLIEAVAESPGAADMRAILARFAYPDTERGRNALRSLADRTNDALSEHTTAFLDCDFRSNAIRIV